MKRLSSAMATILLAAASTGANADTTSYAFDSVSKFDLQDKQFAVTGVLRNTTAPLTVTFADNVNGEYRFMVSRCVPVLLTMMEKPGKYYLNLTWDSTDINLALKNCGLESRS
jgi:hypothetical protein